MRTSSKPKCRAEFDRLQTTIPTWHNIPTNDVPVPGSGSEPDIEVPQVDHAGDLFGNYADLEEREWGAPAEDVDGDWAMGGEGWNGVELDEITEDMAGTDHYEDNLAGEIEAAMALEDEQGWEPEQIRPDHPLRPSSPVVTPAILQQQAADRQALADRHEAEHHLSKRPYVKKYPDARAGAPILGGDAATQISGNNRYGAQLGSVENIWAPFESEMDWKLAQWAKLRGPSSNALTELLAIPEVRT